MGSMMHSVDTTTKHMENTFHAEKRNNTYIPIVFININNFTTGFFLNDPIILSYNFNLLKNKK